MLCAVDVDNTKNSDVLVVGAPFYGNLTQINIDVNNINEDEGKVYVYGFDRTNVSCYDTMNVYTYSSLYSLKK